MLEPKAAISPFIRSQVMLLKPLSTRTGKSLVNHNHVADGDRLRLDTLTSVVKIAALAKRLSDRAGDNAGHDDSYSWEQATDYVDSRQDILAENKGLTPQQLNKHIRCEPDYRGPGSSFMSHAWRLHQIWPEVFCSTTKTLPYTQYAQMANSRVIDKDELRRWAEDYQPSQQELRDRIRELVGDDVLRRGFRLQVTNHWRFPSNDGFDRSRFDGGIDRDVVANLLHYLTEPDDLVIDPMAGSGILGAVVDEMPYFSAEFENRDDTEFGGPRRVLMSDLNPVNSHIIEADAGHLVPFKDAHLVLLDPPYWRIAKGKYAHGPNDFDQWLKFLERVLTNCLAALRTGGHLALILDDYLRSRTEKPLALLGAQLAQSIGFRARMTIYNNYTNATASLDAAGQWRAKKARLMVSGMKIINVFSKDDNS